ncbi:MAG: S9 family peptidase [Deltaproteobacteria bacterium]|nr:S9 family peptidase [Deltaproteobacteria bacterium]
MTEPSFTGFDRSHRNYMEGMKMASVFTKHLQRLFYVIFPLLALCGNADTAADTSTHSSPRATQPPMLLAAEEFYTYRPQRWGHQLSPDGERLAWFERINGEPKLHIRVLGTGHTYFMRLLKHVPGFQWALDNRHVTFRRAVDKHFNVHLFAADTDSPQSDARDITPFEGVNVDWHLALLETPGSVLVRMNRRQHDMYDLYEINIETGHYDLRATNLGETAYWLISRTGSVVGRVQSVADGAWKLQASPGDTGWTTLLTGTFRDTIIPVHNLPEDGARVHMLTNANRDKLAVIELNLNTGEQKVIFEAPDVDTTKFWADVRRYEVSSVLYFDPLPSYFFFDRELQEDFRRLLGTAPVLHNFSSGSLDHTRLIVHAESDRQGTATYFVDRSTGAKEILAEHPLRKHADILSETQPVRFQARDGLPITGYLTLPNGTDGKGLPMVLKVHGGPWLSDSWGFDPETQFLANRGYAVLEVNFRGSTGFGKSFLERGRRQFGRKMQEDLIDAVDWAIAKGHADPERIAIFGHSYGGYATLMAMAQTPYKFAAGISAMAPTDLTLLVDSSRRNPRLSAWWLHFAGDTHNEADYQELKQYSPVTHARRIQRPLLLFHGAKDMRIPKEHFDRLLVELRKGSAPLDYLVLQDERHHIRKTANKLKYARRVERFLAQHLGGRAAPLD